MKYALLKSPFHVDIRDKDIGEPSENEVCVKLSYCGVCGTDKIMAKSWCKDWTPFGHEMAGTVCKTGSKVHGLVAGQKVAVKPGAHCGQCPACVSGNVRKCTGLVIAPGGFAEYITVDRRLLEPAPDDMSLRDVSLAEPLNVAIDIFKTANITEHDAVVLFGPGLIGILAMYLAQYTHANPVAVAGRTRHSYLDAHLEKLGCEFVSFVPQSRWRRFTRRPPVWIHDLQRIISSLTSRLVVIHTAPAWLIEEYIHYLPYETCIVNIGLGSDAAYQLLGPLNMQELMFKRIQLMSSFAVPSLFFGDAIRYLHDGVIDADSFLDKIIRLDQLEGYLRPGRSQRGHMKITVQLDSD